MSIEDGAELRIAEIRRSAAPLAWSALLLIAVAGAAGFLLGNLPDPFEDWMLLSVAAALVLVAVVLPWWQWASRRWIITTRRVIASRGLVVRRRRELSHVAGYGIELSRSPWQRMAGTGTISLSGPGQDIVMLSVRAPRLVQAALVDQLEIGQILAHREAQRQAADPFLERSEERPAT